MIKNLLIIGILFLGCSMSVLAQKTVAGTVLDENSDPLIGVSIQEIGTFNGTTTSITGDFEITVQEGASLRFTFIGYLAQKVLLNGKTNINITMLPDDTALGEVVVVGYGTERKSDITGSVSSVSGDDIIERPVFNALQGLQGKVAGVTIFSNSGAPGGKPRVRIRGAGSINTSVDPLYVVDGVVMNGDIEFLNPNDIERIEVLKDASSTAIYGSRGANGVILISTKRGAKKKGVVVTYSGYASVGVLAKELDLLNSEQWLEVVKKGLETSEQVYGKNISAYKDILDNPELFDSNGKPLYNTNWQKEATRTAISHDHSLSIQQMGETASVGGFLNYGKHEGIMLGSDLERFSGKLVFDIKANDWLNFGMNILVNNTLQNEVREGGGGQYPRRSLIEMVPILPVKFPDGRWSNSKDATGFGLENMANPVHVLSTQERVNKRTQLFGNFMAQVKLAPGLDIKTQYGFDKLFHSFQNFSPAGLLNISSTNAWADVARSIEDYWQSETFLTYQKVFGKHRINSVFGMSWQERVWEELSGGSSIYPDNTLSFYKLQAGSDPGSPSTGHTQWSMNSYFGRVGYVFNDKYLATATVRYDGASRLGDNNKWGMFPSLGLGWIVSNEGFMEEQDFINNLKLRASIGKTGNSGIGIYSTLATVNAGTTLIGGALQTSTSVSKIANPDLKWESTVQYDLGFELSMFDNRVSVEFDYYNRLTSDLLLARPLPSSTGFSSVVDNIGEVSNKGVDFLITTKNIENKNFSWETTFNLNYNKNEVLALGENDEDMQIAWWVGGANAIIRVGESLNSFYGYKRLGTWGTDEAAEAAQVGAKPGEAKRSKEKEIIGKGLPDFSGSFSNTFRYKNFDLSIDLEYVYGVEVMQQYFHSTEDRSGIANGFSTILTDSWTPENQNTMVQRIRHQGTSGQNSLVDDHWVVDGSFIRGRSLSFGYNFQSGVLSKLKVSKVRVHASVENFFLISSKDFLGYDPQTTSSGDQFGQNMTFFQYPRPRTFTAGISITL